MTYITYTSSRGTLTAGTRPHLSLTLCALSGLAPPLREYTVQSYLGIDGQETISSRLLPRTVTLSIERKPDCGVAPRDIYRLLSEAGTLYIRREDVIYKLRTNQATVSEEVKNGDFRVYTAQYVCDDPYFTDEKRHHVSCFELSNHICYEKESDTWTLGTSEKLIVWTSTGSTQRILNNGDTPIEPILTVVGVGTSDEDAYIDFVISHDGHEYARITLNHAPSDGEAITLNCDGRSDAGRGIVSSLYGNITDRKSDETSLARFRFPEGDNVLSLVYHSSSGSLSAYLEYDVRYEGVSLWN